MASQFTGLNRGQTRTDIVTGAATNSTDMEFRADLTKGLTAQDVVVALEELIIWYQTVGNGPPP